MDNNNYIITHDADMKDTNYTYLIRAILKYLRENYDKNLSLYEMRTMPIQCWTGGYFSSPNMLDPIVLEIVKYDVYNKVPKFITHVNEFFDKYGNLEELFDPIPYKVPFSKRADIPLNNSIHYYESMGIFVVFASVESFKGESFTKTDICLLFTSSIDRYREFIDYLHKRRDEISSRDITIVYNTQHGTSEEYLDIDKITMTMDDILIDSLIKEEIYRSMEQFILSDGEFFRKYNIPYRRGILLYGPPGTGKSSLIRVLINTFKIKTLYWQISEYTNSNSISEVFKIAERDGCKLFVIEDLEGINEQTRSTLLNTLDGINTSNNGLFTIATTNYPDKIDPALIGRVGRFDRSYEIGIPIIDYRRLYLEKRNIRDFLSDDDFELIICETDGFSLASLNEIYTSVALQYHYDGKVDICNILNYMKNIKRKTEKNDFIQDSSKSLGFTS